MVFFTVRDVQAENEGPLQLTNMRHYLGQHCGSSLNTRDLCFNLLLLANAWQSEQKEVPLLSNCPSPALGEIWGWCFILTGGKVISWAKSKAAHDSAIWWHLLSKREWHNEHRLCVAGSFKTECSEHFSFRISTTSWRCSSCSVFLFSFCLAIFTFLWRSCICGNISVVFEKSHIPCLFHTII